MIYIISNNDSEPTIYLVEMHEYRWTGNAFVNDMYI